MAEAQLRDQHGNPIQLTDQYGNPVKLTDEHGHPVHLSGVATTTPTAGSTTTGTHTSSTGFGTYGGAAGATATGTGFGTTLADHHVMATERRSDQVPVSVYQREPGEQLRRSGSSSSSSSEDDGHGGRRKKKGLKDKIKEKLPVGGGGARDQHPQTRKSTTTSATGVTHPMTTTTATGATHPTTTTTATGATHPTTTTAGAAHHPEHAEKKGIMEKIKEKLPGGHHSH